MKKRLSLISLVLAIILFLPVPAAAVEASSKKTTSNNPIEEHDEGVLRLEGKNRYETSVNISRNVYNRANRIVLVSGESFQDALSASSLTLSSGPVLLTNKDFLPEVVKDEILRLEPENIYILGGSNTISNETEGEVKKLGFETERIAGVDRYETSALVAEKTGKTGLMLASGESFADALPASSVAAITKSNILLTQKDSLHTATKDFIESIKESDDLNVAGGNSTISDNIVKEVEDIYGVKAKRLFASNRYGTSVSIANYYFEMLDSMPEVILASGESFPDALATSTLVDSKNMPILLVEKDHLPIEIEDFLLENQDSIDKLIVIGGENTISKKVVNRAQKCIVDGAERPEPEMPTFIPMDRSTNSNGQSIFILENKLKEYNYFLGQPDQVFDAETEIALRYFMFSEGLEISSTLTEEAWNKLHDGTVKKLDREGRGATYIDGPYTSQVDGIKAWVSCIPISLYMSLQHKGTMLKKQGKDLQGNSYALNITAKQFLDVMPRHRNDPRLGYAGNPYARTEVWPGMASDVLAKFGSNYGPTADVSHAPFYSLVDELYMGNPVVITPTLYWVRDGAKRMQNYETDNGPFRAMFNLHGLVMTAYKPGAGVRLTDPYNQPEQGGIPGKPLISYKDYGLVDELYNYTGYAVVVR